MAFLYKILTFFVPKHTKRSRNLEEYLPLGEAWLRLWLRSQHSVAPCLLVSTGPPSAWACTGHALSPRSLSDDHTPVTPWPLTSLCLRPWRPLHLARCPAPHGPWSGGWRLPRGPVARAWYWSQWPRAHSARVSLYCVFCVWLYLLWVSQCHLSWLVITRGTAIRSSRHYCQWPLLSLWKLVAQWNQQMKSYGQLEWFPVCLPT